MADFVRCVECGQKYRVSEKSAGRRVKCRQCGAVFQMPGLGAIQTGSPVAEKRAQKSSRRRKSSSASSADGRSSRSVWIGAAGGIVVAGVLIVGFILIRGDGLPKEPAEAASDSTVADASAVASAEDTPGAVTAGESSADSTSPDAGQPPSAADDDSTVVQVADVAVANQTPLPLSEENGWNGIPVYLRGAVIYSGTPKPGRTVRFTVEKDGVIAMAASWDYDGNRSGGWYETRSTKESLQQDGWVPLDSMSLTMGDNNEHQYTVFGRRVTAGEAFQFHTRKYNPPFVIALNDEQAEIVLARTEPPKVALADAEPANTDLPAAAPTATEPPKESEPTESRPPAAKPAETNFAKADSPQVKPAPPSSPTTQPPAEPGVEPAVEPTGDDSKFGIERLQVVDMTPTKLEGENIPNYLRDAVIFRRELSGNNLEQGLLEFSAAAPLTVLLQVSWQGLPVREVRDEYKPRKTLIRDGWVSAGRCPWAEEDELFIGQITTPYKVTIRVRTNNYRPPWLIVTDAPNVRDAADEPAIPQVLAARITTTEARNHLLTEDYDWLEETGDLFRTPLARHHSGYLKLVAFYEGLSVLPRGTDAAGYESRDQQLKKWLDARPESMAAKIATAAFLRRYAWFARGTGSGSSVTEEGGRLFHERLNHACELLQPLVDARVNDPVIYQELTSCSTGLGHDAARVDSYLEEAARIDPSFLGVVAGAAYYYLPRWHGDDDDVVQLADRVVELTREELGLGGYAMVVETVRSLHPKVFDDFEFSWEKTKQGFEDLFRRYPHDRTWYDRCCLAAAAAEDHETVSDMLAVIGDQPAEWIWPAGNYFRRLAQSYSAEAVAGDQLVLMRGDVDPIVQFDITQDSVRIVSTDMKDRIFVHNVETGKMESEAQLQRPFNVFTCLPISNLLAIGWGGGQLSLYSLEAGHVEEIGRHDRRIVGLEASNDGSVMVSASQDGEIRIWERGKREPQHTLTVPVKKFLQDVALSDNGTMLAAVCDTGRVYLCDTRTGEITSDWEAGIYPGLVAIAPSGERLAIRSRVEPGAMSQVVVSVWDIKSQKKIAQSEPQPWVASFDFHPSRAVLAVGMTGKSSEREGGVSLWSYLQEDAVFEPLSGHGSGVYDCQFFPDGRLASSGADGTVRVWDIR